MSQKGWRGLDIGQNDHTGVGSEVAFVCARQIQLLILMQNTAAAMPVFLNTYQ